MLGDNVWHGGTGAVQGPGGAGVGWAVALIQSWGHFTAGIWVDLRVVSESARGCQVAETSRQKEG